MSNRSQTLLKIRSTSSESKMHEKLSEGDMLQDLMLIRYSKIVMEAEKAI